MARKGQSLDKAEYKCLHITVCIMKLKETCPVDFTSEYRQNIPQIMPMSQIFFGMGMGSVHILPCQAGLISDYK